MSNGTKAKPIPSNAVCSIREILLYVVCPLTRTLADWPSLSKQLQGLEDRLLANAPNVKAAAGAIVTLDRNPQAALAAVVHDMMQTVLQKGYYRRECLPLGLCLTE